MARVVAPGMPHHVTQRGNRRMQTFFVEADYEHYIASMAKWCKQFAVSVWAYCLMPNHVHFVLVPENAAGLHRAVSEAHRRYTRHVNAREGWTGHLWQGRFASFVMDEAYLLAAVRYIELNPVRAGLAAWPERYPWSSAEAHMTGRDDGLVHVEPMLSRVEEWAAYLARDVGEAESSALRRHERTGRPSLGRPGLHRAPREPARSLPPQAQTGSEESGRRQLNMVFAILPPILPWACPISRAR